MVNANLAKGLIAAGTQSLEEYAAEVLESLAGHALHNDARLVAFEANMGAVCFRVAGGCEIDETLLREDARATLAFADWCFDHFGHQIPIFMTKNPCESV